MKKLFLAFVSIVLSLVLILGLTGCNSKVKATNLMEGITPKISNNNSPADTDGVMASDFAVRLFKASLENDKNVLVSPLSVLSALAMTANGAKGTTLSQMENVLGGDINRLNSYLKELIKNLPTGEKYKLSLANSIWFTDDNRFTVNEDFLQLNADFYGADIYKAPFDKTTLKDINNWVKQKTDGMIPTILDEIPKEAIMYLVNALSFEAEWSEIYKKTQVRDGVFTLRDGTKQTVEFMYSTEGQYLADDYAKGFIKYYNGGKYAFVALLPDKGVSVYDYVDLLSGESLNAMLSNPTIATVNAAIPKFENEYETEMSKTLSSMGMDLAFNPELAEFSELGSSTDGNIYISRVLHKTYISVGEKGTKAGAATVVEANDECALVEIEPKTVYLDRPFVYMLIETNNKTPFFIGCQMSVK